MGTVEAQRDEGRVAAAVRVALEPPGVGRHRGERVQQRGPEREHREATLVQEVDARRVPLDPRRARARPRKRQDRLVDPQRRIRPAERTREAPVERHHRAPANTGRQTHDGVGPEALPPVLRISSSVTRPACAAPRHAARSASAIRPRAAGPPRRRQLARRDRDDEPRQRPGVQKWWMRTARGVSAMPAKVKSAASRAKVCAG